MRTRIILAGAIAATILLIVAVGYVTACCEADVKVEWDGTQWAYDPDVNSGSVVVTGTERIICWQVITDTNPRLALYEIGVKAGPHTDWFFPTGTDRVQGCYEAGWHDLSSAWFCVEELSTAVRLTEFRAGAEQECNCWHWLWVGMLLGSLCMALGVLGGYSR